MWHALTLSTSWWFVYRLQEISGGAFTVAEEHGGNNYDTLTLYDRDQLQIMSFNRPGHLHIWCTMNHELTEGQDRGSSRMIDIWPEIERSSPQTVLDEIVRLIELPVPEKSLPATPATLLSRLASEILTLTVFDEDYCDCRSGYCDGALIPYEIRRHLFEPFPEPGERLSQPIELARKEAAKFWFIVQKREPLLCLETNGIVYTKNGRVISLLELYKENGGKMAKIVAEMMREWV